MSQEYLEQRFNDWKQTPELELRLERLQLIEIPEIIIVSEVKITRLSLFANALTCLSKDLTKNHPLETLDLSFNNFKEIKEEQIEEFIEALSNLKELKEFQFTENTLPEPKRCLEEIIKLSKLIKLDLRSVDMSFELGQCLSKLYECKNLENLSLASCNLHGIPRDIGKIQKLKILDVSFNHITTLELSCFGSTLIDFKAEACGISYISNFGINYLENLEKLDLSCNELIDLPADFSFLTSLKYVLLGFNNLDRIPNVLVPSKDVREQKLIKSLEYISLGGNFYQPKKHYNDSTKIINDKLRVNFQSYKTSGKADEIIQSPKGYSLFLG